MPVRLQLAIVCQRFLSIISFKLVEMFHNVKTKMDNISKAYLQRLDWLISSYTIEIQAMAEFNFSFGVHIF